MAARQPRKREPRKGEGRPSIYTPALAAAICAEVANGKSIREICRAERMPAMSSVFLWLSKHPEFSEQYARAREAQADYMADEILEISDDARNDWMDRQQGDETVRVVDHEHISRSKLRVDTRKWLLAKLQPKKYGERVSQEITGKDGGPIETTVNDAEAGRRIAFLLAKALVAQGAT